MILYKLTKEEAVEITRRHKAFGQLHHTNYTATARTRMFEGENLYHRELYLRESEFTRVPELQQINRMNQRLLGVCAEPNEELKKPLFDLEGDPYYVSFSIFEKSRYVNGYWREASVAIPLEELHLIGVHFPNSDEEFVEDLWYNENYYANIILSYKSSIEEFSNCTFFAFGHIQWLKEEQYIHISHLTVRELTAEQEQRWTSSFAEILPYNPTNLKDEFEAYQDSDAFQKNEAARKKRRWSSYINPYSWESKTNDSMSPSQYDSFISDEADKDLPF